MPRLGLGLGLAKGSVLPTIDAEALALYNRVIADGGIVPAGLSGMDAYIKAAKAARGISTLAQGYLSLAHPHYTGIRLATGTGPTAGNRAARTVYNAIGATGDFIQTTAANQPLALVHSGQNYAWLPGVIGNYFSTPNATANQITGDIDITIYAGNYKAGRATYVAKYSGATRSYLFCQESANTLNLYLNTDSIIATSSTINPLINSNGWLRVTRNATTGQVKFYYSTQSFSTALNSIVWEQIGSDISTTAGAIVNTSVPVEIGAWSSGHQYLSNMVIYRATISNSIGGTPVVDFNPTSYNRATNQTTWTSSTGEVWTLNTPSTNNDLKAAIVDTTMIMGNGTSYGMQAASLNMDQPAITSYTAFRKYVNTAGTQRLLELGSDTGSFPGFNIDLNPVADEEWIAFRANVGQYVSRYSNSNLGLKLATEIRNIANANEANPYLINNVSQTLIGTPQTNNNTANMNATGYNLLARNNAASLWANAFIVADCVTIGEDNTTQQTSMYNFFKSYINGI